jgi:hypothetical protein
MKRIIYISTTLFVLHACQGRGLPPHPAAYKTLFESNSNKTAKSSKNEVNNNDNYPTLKLESKALNEKDSLANIPIVNKLSSSILPDISKIPILKDIKRLVSSSSKMAKRRTGRKRQYTYVNVKSFSGGSPVNGLDIGLVRLGQSSHYTRLIFDSYKWEGYAQLPVEKVNDSGTYIFTYEPKNKRIVGILDGYQAFSALVGDHTDLYEGNTMIKTIHIDEYLDKSGFKFTIELKQDAKIRVYELHNPARIIIDLAPLNEG